MSRQYLVMIKRAREDFADPPRRDRPGEAHARHDASGGRDGAAGQRLALAPR
jgi:hypothetical protein